MPPKKKRVPAVYELIKSLDKSEKIHFKREYGNKNASSKKAYLVLFDTLDKLKEFDQQKLEAKFSKTSFGKHLSANFNYLYQLILESLRNFHIGKNDRIKAEEMIGQIRVLLTKRLHTQAEKQIHRAWKFCEEREYNEYLSILSQFLYNLSVVKMTKDEFIHRQNAISTSKKNLQILHDRVTLYGLNNELVKIEKEKEVNPQVDFKNDLERIQQQFQKVEARSNEESELSKLFYFSGLARFMRISKQPLQSLYFNRKQIDVYVNMPKVLQYSTTALTIMLYNYLSKCTELFFPAGIKSSLPFLQQVCEENANLTVKCKVLRLIFMMRYHLMNGDKDLGAQLISEYEPALDLLLEKSVPFYKMHIYESFAWFYFLTENYDACQHWMQKMFEVKDMTVIDKHLFPARLMEVMIQFQWGNHQLLNSLGLSVLRYVDTFKQDTSNFLVEECWLRQMRKVENYYFPGQAKEFLTETIAIFQENYEEDLFPVPLHLVLLKSWTAAQLTNKSVFECWAINAKNICQEVATRYSKMEKYIVEGVERL